MDLHQQLLEAFGIDFPISGGSGTSKADAIVLARSVPNDYVGKEYAIIDCICKLQGVSFTLVGQKLFKGQDKVIDSITVETQKLTDDGVVAQTVTYFFDITACFR